MSGDQTPNFSIRLGKKARSRTSGFTGVITARSQYLHGCNRYGLQPPVDKDGKFQDSYWFDEADIEVIEGEELARENSERGGPVSRHP